MKRLRRKIKRLFTKKHKIYNNIETCPYWNYHNASQDIRYLYILKNYENLPKYNNDLKKAYESLNLQIIELKGFSNEQKMIITKEKEIEIYKIKITLGMKVDTVRFQRALESFSKMINIFNQNVISDIDEKIVMIEKYMKINIDPKKISIKKYIAYVSNMEKYYKELAKTEKRNNI